MQLILMSLLGSLIFLFLIWLIYDSITKPRENPFPTHKKHKKHKKHKTSGRSSYGLNRRAFNDIGTRKTQDVHMVRISNDLDGPIKSFGIKFWEKIESYLPEKNLYGSRLLHVSYKDRYLMNPLTLRLLWEVLKNVPGKNVNSEVEIGTLKTNYESVNPNTVVQRTDMAFHRNWPDPQMRIDVMRDLFLDANIEFWEGRIRAHTPHDRSLRLEFDGGKFLKINLDQGFGAWKTKGWVSFDVDSSVDRQVKRIKNLNLKIENISKDYPTIFVLEWDGSNSDRGSPSGLDELSRLRGEFRQRAKGVPMSDIAERVKKIVVEHLGVDEADVVATASFIGDLRADSLDTVELVMAFEEEFGIEIRDEDAETINTFGDAVNFIIEATDAS